jgi:hypothetical protein
MPYNLMTMVKELSGLDRNANHARVHMNATLTVRYIIWI